MKKKFYILILFCIAFFALYLCLIPYQFDTRLKDYSPDVVFETIPEIEQVDVTFDYREMENMDRSVSGRVYTEYQLKYSSNTRAVVPFYGALNAKKENGQSAMGKNLEATINDERISSKVLYGGSELNRQELNTYTYSDLKNALYESNKTSDTYYVYNFELNKERLGLDHWVVGQFPYLTMNLEVVSSLTKKEERELEDTNYRNHLLFETNGKTSTIITTGEVDDYFCTLEEEKGPELITSGKMEKIVIEGSDALYTYFLKNYDVVLEDAILIAENEITPLFENKGIMALSFDDLMNKERLMLFDFDIPHNASKLAIAYNNVAGMDSRYEEPLYEIVFNYTRANYKNTHHFNVTYKLPSSMYNNFSVFSLEEKEEKVFTHYADTMPLEVKLYFSSLEVAKKDIHTFKIEISGFASYILLPFLLLVLGIALIMGGMNRYFIARNAGIGVKEIFFKIKDLFVEHIPELLTLFMLGFKFFTLYKNDSSLNRTNLIILIVFIVCCLLYFIKNSMTRVNYFKLFFYGILACVVGFIVYDPAFIMLIALGVCFTQKGPKPFLKAMLVGILFFSLQTVLLSAYNIVPNAKFEVWETGSVRHSLGFTNPNTVSLFLFVGCLCLILYKKPSFFERLIMVMLVGVVYFVTKSRTGCLCVLLLVVLDILSDFVKFKGKWRYIMVGVFPLFTILSFIVVKNYGWDPNNYVNKLLSNRPLMIINYLRLDWFTLTGMPLLDDYLANTSGLPIDNLYMNALILQGFISYVVYLIIYVILSYKVVKTRNMKYFVGLFVYFTYSLAEATLMSYSCAIFVALLFISTLGDKYEMDGSLLPRKERTCQRILYIVSSMENLVLDNNCWNVILILGNENREEMIGQNRIVYVKKSRLYFEILKHIRRLDPDDIHLYYPNHRASFAILTTVFKGNLVLHLPKEETTKRYKHGLMKKSSLVVEE